MSNGDRVFTQEQKVKLTHLIQAVAEEFEIKPSVLKKAVKTAYKADFSKHSEDLAELENILATVGKLQ